VAEGPPKISTMRILHISEKHTLAAGGTTKAVHDLADALQRRGHEGAILASGLEPRPAPDGVRLATTAAENTVLGRLWHYSPSFPDLLRAEVEAFTPDIVHIHGFWMGPQYVAAKIAHDLGIPTVLSVHGSLFYERWQQGKSLARLKKGVYARLLACPRFSGVSLLHAITGQERELLAQMFPNMPMVQIPNWIDPGDAPGALQPPQRHFAFIGRISPEKNLENLILGFMQARLDTNWRLSIVGPTGDAAYLAHLKKVAVSAGGRIDFPGPLYGADKERLLASLQAVVVPSFTEVISLVNLECAAAGIPTITTRETGLVEWQDHGGLLSSVDATSLAGAMESAARWTPGERQSRGVSLRALVEQKYSERVVSAQWLQAYSGLLSGG
jgi:glycosyltransferase involved in cell wall biosynthesis